MAYRSAGAGLVGAGLLLGAACGGDKPPADPSGVPPSSILIASAPEGFSTHHLGAPYDANFELLGGKAGRTLFPKGEVHKSAQNRLTTEFVEARDQEHFAAHASAWHLVRTQASIDGERTFVSRRLVQVADVLELDETRGGRKAPDEAVYYPGKVYLGWSYEVVCEVSKSALAAGFEANLLVARGGVEAFSRDKDARCQSLGVGVTFDSKKAVFATDLNDVQRGFRSGAPVPVLVEWHRIPGRKGRQAAAPKPHCAGTVGCERCEAWEFAHVSWTVPQRDPHGAVWDGDDSPPDVQVTLRGPGGIALSSPELPTYAFDWMLEKPVRLATGSQITLVATDRDAFQHDPMTAINSEPLPAFLPDSTWKLAGDQMALRGRCVAPE
jgi:hypothetical protein